MELDIFIFDESEDVIEAITECFVVALNECDLMNFSIKETTDIKEAEKTLQEQEFDVVILNGGGTPTDSTPRIQPLLFIPKKNNKTFTYIYTGIIKLEELNIALRLNINGYYDKLKTSPIELVDIIISDIKFYKHYTGNYDKFSIFANTEKEEIKKSRNQWAAFLNGEIIASDTSKITLMEKLKFTEIFRTNNWPTFFFVDDNGEIKYG